MDERKIHNLYQIRFKNGLTSDTISVDCIPPYVVGQSIVLDKKYPDGSRTTKDYTIIEINHFYSYMLSVDQVDEFNTLSIELVLEEIK